MRKVWAKNKDIKTIHNYISCRLPGVCKKKQQKKRILTRGLHYIHIPVLWIVSLDSKQLEERQANIASFSGCSVSPGEGTGISHVKEMHELSYKGTNQINYFLRRRKFCFVYWGMVSGRGLLGNL
jgi:hypothetical protein